MKDPEIHPAVDAKNVQARCNAEAFSEATKRAVAEATVLAEVVKRRRCKRATLALIVRLVAFIILAAGFNILRHYHHLTPEVAVFFLCSLSCWFAMWVGAGAQFMWGKEGLLK